MQFDANKLMVSKDVSRQMLQFMARYSSSLAESIYWHEIASLFDDDDKVGYYVLMDQMCMLMDSLAPDAAEMLRLIEVSRLGDECDFENDMPDSSVRTNKHEELVPRLRKEREKAKIKNNLTASLLVEATPKHSHVTKSKKCSSPEKLGSAFYRNKLLDEGRLGKCRQYLIEEVRVFIDYEVDQRMPPSNNSGRERAKMARQITDNAVTVIDTLIEHMECSDIQKAALVLNVGKHDSDLISLINMSKSVHDNHEQRELCENILCLDSFASLVLSLIEDEIACHYDSN